METETRPVHGAVEHPLIRQGRVEKRLYQEKIAEAASRANTLVILPTALGKTIISVLVAADALYKYRGSRVLVMAPTRPLVLQHMNTYLNALKLRPVDTAILTGETPPHLRETVWRGGARLVFATPQVVRNDLREGRVTLTDYSLLVFDECHRAVGDYSYREIAGRYAEQATYSCILGLTASPGSEAEKLLEVCRGLYVEHVEYRTEEDPDVSPYIQDIVMEWKPVKLPAVYQAARAQIRSLLEKRLNWLRARGHLRGGGFTGRGDLLRLGEELRYQMEMSIEEERGRLIQAIVNQSLGLTIFHMLELLETQGIHTLLAFTGQVEAKSRKYSYAVLAKDPEYVALRDLLLRNPVEHPKATLLLGMVDEEVGLRPSTRILVFTQYRETAAHLAEMLSRVPGVRAHRFVGQSSRAGDEGLSQDEQARRIEMLRSGELNVLVCTSIGEEGLDIPSVDHVYFYEPIPSGIRYIQRRGRTGRRTSGRVTILAAEDTLDYTYLYASRRRTERMRRLVLSIEEGLPEVVRSRPPRPPDPMTAEELWALEDQDGGDEERAEVMAAPRGLVEAEEAEGSQSTMLRETRRLVERAAKEVYLRLLERGAEGASVDQLAWDMDDPGLSILGPALKKLGGQGLVSLSGDRYVASTSLRRVGETHTVWVDKVHRGYAEVTVDEGERATLVVEEYDGPSGLLRKGARFRAVAEVYGRRGNRHIWVKEVVEVLERR